MSKKSATESMALALSGLGATAAAPAPAAKKTRVRAKPVAEPTAAEKVAAAFQEGTKVMDDVDNVSDAEKAASTETIVTPEPTKEKKSVYVPGTNKALCKEIWSSRGMVFAILPGFPIPVALVKKVLTVYLEQADPNGKATHKLVERADNTGSDFIPVEASADEQE